MCSSKHLDRTRSGPGSEQIRRVNSISDKIYLASTCDLETNICLSCLRTWLYVKLLPLQNCCNAA